MTANDNAGKAALGKYAKPGAGRQINQLLDYLRDLSRNRVHERPSLHHRRYRRHQCPLCRRPSGPHGVREGKGILLCRLSLPGNGHRVVPARCRATGCRHHLPGRGRADLRRSGSVHQQSLADRRRAVEGGLRHRSGAPDQRLRVHCPGESPCCRAMRATGVGKAGRRT